MDEPRPTLVLGAHHQETATLSPHDSVNALAADIVDWVEHWNENPTPFVWHRTADEILERLDRYCVAVIQDDFINGSA